MMRLTNCYGRLLFCTLLCSLMPSTVLAEALGRIFYSSEERQLLERADQTVTQQAPGEQNSSQTTSVRFNGVMKVRNGRTNAWVNGAALDSPAGNLPLSDGLQIELRGEHLLVRHHGNQQLLRAGDSTTHAIPSATPGDAAR